MATKPAVRNYKMSDGELKRAADGLVLCMDRDANDFETVQITKRERYALKDLSDGFDNVTTDEEQRGGRSEATLHKDRLAEEVRVRVRSIRGMADRAFNGQGAYNRFGFTGMSTMNDNDLYMLGCRVVRVGNQLLTELAAKGPVATELTGLTALNKDFNTALDVAHDEDVLRHIATQARINQGNAIWTMMNDIAKAGKQLYQDKDEAKYRQYVLTDSTTGGTDTTPDVPAA